MHPMFIVWEVVLLLISQGIWWISQIFFSILQASFGGIAKKHEVAVKVASVFGDESEEEEG